MVLKIDIQVRGSSGWAAGSDARATRDRVEVSKVDVEIFALNRPALSEGVFEAAADGPTATPF